MTAKIIVLADDLSGAAELAGIAFARGLSAEVRRVGPAVADRAGPPSDVIAIDTDSRHLPPAAAAERVQQVTRRILELHPAWLFKKVDSVLRGNVRAETEAILEATGQSRALLLPANPTRGRIISGGRYLINGVPLDQTPFAHDPQHPRISSDVLALLGLSSMEPPNIVVPDVENESQLDQLVSECNLDTLAAGAADFFAALLRYRSGTDWGRESISPSRFPNGRTSTEIDSRPLGVVPPALLVCGSAAAWHDRQAACTAAGIPHTTIDDHLREPQSFRAFLLGIGESVKPEPLSALAQAAANLIQRSAITTLLAEGGATAAAIAQQLNWTRFTIVATAPAGIGVLRPITDQPAPLFLIKPGSYPWPPEIWNAFCRR